MTFCIVSEAGNYYLDINQNCMDPGTKLIGYPFHGQKNQQFYLKENHLFSALSGLVIDANIADGRIITAKQTTSPNQLWFFQDDGSIRNCYNQCFTLIKNKNSDKQGDIFLSTWSNLPTQKWRIVTTE